MIGIRPRCSSRPRRGELVRLDGPGRDRGARPADRSIRVALRLVLPQVHRGAGRGQQPRDPAGPRRRDALRRRCPDRRQGLRPGRTRRPPAACKATAQFTLGDGDDVARVVDTRPPPAPSDLTRGPSVRIEAGAGADSAHRRTGRRGLRRRRRRRGRPLQRRSGRRPPVLHRTQAARADHRRAPSEDVLGHRDARGRLRQRPPHRRRPAERTVGRAGQGHPARARRATTTSTATPAPTGCSAARATMSSAATATPRALGRDLLGGGRGDDFIDLGAADDEVLSVGGPTFEEDSDGRRDTARGGPGYDTLITTTAVTGCKDVKPRVLDGEVASAARSARVANAIAHACQRDPGRACSR